MLKQTSAAKTIEAVRKLEQRLHQVAMDEYHKSMQENDYTSALRNAKRNNLGEAKILEPGLEICKKDILDGTFIEPKKAYEYFGVNEKLLKNVAESAFLESIVHGNSSIAKDIIEHYKLPKEFLILANRHDGMDSMTLTAELRR